LAFREAPHLIKLINKLRDDKPEFLPQVILIDGNGILHTNGFGLASHLGVLADIPTVGCGKTVFYVDGLSKDRVRKLCDDNLKKGGDYVELKGDSGRVWGAALRSNDKTTDPLIISVGHKISLDTALTLIKKCCTKYRIPEPIRRADLESRAVIRNKVNKMPIFFANKNDMEFFNKEDPTKNKGDDVDDDDADK